ncbi:MAG: thermonuclease family protein [Candidatus Levyibacteriota bacterium]
MKRILLVISFLFLALVPRVHAQDTTFKVLKVIDGDTIQVDIRGKKETVRLLGIDTPETVDPRKPVQCFGEAASDKMKSIVSGKSVILINDSTQGNRDKYNRLLRYVYLPDKVRTFVNGEMVKQGFAFSYRQYPTKMLTKFNNFETYAREHKLGLWGSCPVNAASTPKTTKTTIQKTIAPTRSYVAPVRSNSIQTTTNATGGFSCSGKTTCGQMTSCSEAQFYLNSCGVSRLDGDKDGTPCESLCN